jgi:hypothetical protein
MLKYKILIKLSVLNCVFVSCVYGDTVHTVVVVVVVVLCLLVILFNTSYFIFVNCLTFYVIRPSRTPP